MDTVLQRGCEFMTPFIWNNDLVFFFFGGGGGWERRLTTKCEASHQPAWELTDSHHGGPMFVLDGTSGGFKAPGSPAAQKVFAPNLEAT